MYAWVWQMERHWRRTNQRMVRPLPEQSASLLDRDTPARAQCAHSHVIHFACDKTFPAGLPWQFPRSKTSDKPMRHLISMLCDRFAYSPAQRHVRGAVRIRRQLAALCNQFPSLIYARLDSGTTQCPSLAAIVLSNSLCQLQTSPENLSRLSFRHKLPCVVSRVLGSRAPVSPKMSRSSKALEQALQITRSPI